MNRTSARLWVVATPIGHLADFSPRAIDTLKQCAIIFCEDTRHSLPLLKHFGINAPLRSLHEHNEKMRIAEVVRELASGLQVGLISDAGTPAVSDPGALLIAAVRTAGFAVSPIPGASALLSAWSVSGMNNHNGFTFIGFLSTDNKPRQTLLTELLRAHRPFILYESPHRLMSTLEDLQRHFAETHPIFFARELTKMHEQSARTTLGDLIADIENGAIPLLGEWVLIVPPKEEREERLIPSSTLAQTLMDELGDHASPSVLSRVIGRLTDLPRQQIYQRLMERGKE